MHVSTADAGSPSDNTVPLRTDTVRVDLGARGYDIIVGVGLLDQIDRLITPVLERKRVAVITDSNVGPLYRTTVEAALSRSSITFETFVLPAGEATKTFGQIERLTEALLAEKAERGMTLLALGGGVIGDITGFVAAILLRGVPFIQIPTTLLAQVDSSVGGKTGVNSAHGKNLIGSFYQPRLVVADMAVLEQLPVRELRAGYAETLKYGLIDDPEFFTWLEAHGTDLLAGDRDARRHAVVHCCQAKARIVAEDEREAGRRALLNLGHTFAHAIEAEAGYGGRVLHGEAVALGMVLAFRLSARLGHCDRGDGDRLERHLIDTGLPARAGDVDINWSPAALIEHMSRDKKVQDGRVTFVLARGIGQAFTTNDVPDDALKAVLAEFADGPQ